MARLLAAFLALSTSAFAQDPNAVSPRDIERAIHKGTEFLKAAPFTPDRTHPCANDLILLTLIHADVPESNAVLQQYLKNCLESPLEKTYNVALQAMCLEQLDPTGYQQRLAQCAQFLVDNQASNGQWSYGRPTDLKKYSFEGKKEEKKVATGKNDGARDFGGGLTQKAKPKNPIVVTQQRQSGASGDNSNSQYASLGLRACWDANIQVPLEVCNLAKKWWIESQSPDESGSKLDKNAVGTGPGETAKIQGWDYKNANEAGAKAPYPAMTAGAVGAVVIYDYILGINFKKDSVAVAGVNWLGKHFAVSGNLYYMYGLERAGMLYGTEKFGDHDWYLEGAKSIVHSQKDDGSWGVAGNEGRTTISTCFAILFLKKATRAIATGDRK